MTGETVGVWLVGLVEWARSAGSTGIVAFAGAYIVAPVLMLPAWPLTLAAGFIYGPLLGLLIVSPASVAGATCAFLVGRGLLRSRLERRLAGDVRFGALDRAIGTEGLRIVLLLRLSPLFPFNLINYALGVTGVRLRDFALASFVGMLPITAMYTYLGSLLTSASHLLSGRQLPAGGWSQTFYWTGFAATVVVTISIARLARRALAEVLAPETAEPA